MYDDLPKRQYGDIEVAVALISINDTVAIAAVRPGYEAMTDGGIDGWEVVLGRGLVCGGDARFVTCEN